MPRTHRFLYSVYRDHPRPAPNIVHLTLNKAASQNTAKVLGELLRERGYTAVWPNRYAFFRAVPYLDALSLDDLRRHRNLFEPKSVFVAAIAQPIVYPEFLEKTRQILAVRDPRDLLVSDYYSIRYFHPAPSATDKVDDFHRRRAMAVEAGLDAYVLANLDRVRQRFERYAEISLHPNCLAVTRYEDFVTDFPGWVADLEWALELPPDPGRLERLRRFAPKRRTTPQKSDKIRAGRAGQYRDELTAVTIARLDRELAAVLQTFGYAPAADDPDAAA
jgi:hypothetical protein